MLTLSTCLTVDSKTFCKFLEIFEKHHHTTKDFAYDMVICIVIIRCLMRYSFYISVSHQLNFAFVFIYSFCRQIFTKASELFRNKFKHLEYDVATFLTFHSSSPYIYSQPLESYNMTTA